MELVDTLIQSSLSPMTLVAESGASVVDGSFVLYGHAAAASKSGDAVILLATSRSASHHQSIFRKMGLASGVVSGTTSMIGAPVHSTTVPSSASESHRGAASVQIIDLQDPMFTLADDSFNAQAVINAVSSSSSASAALDRPSSAGASSTSHRPAAGAASAAGAGTLVVLEDIGPIVERCDSLAAAQIFLSQLLSACSSSSSGGGGASRRRLTLRCNTDCDWSLAATPSVFAVSLLEWLFAQAHVIVKAAPLPSGYSRDVHGRLVVELRHKQQTASTPSAGTGRAGLLTAPIGATVQGQLPSYLPPVRSVLFRIGVDGRARAIGDVRYGQMGGKGGGVGSSSLSQRQATSDDGGSGQHSALPDPDQVEGDYD